MKSELNTMINMLSDPNKYSLETPIERIVEKDSDFITFGDTYLEAGGILSEKLFW